MTRAPVAPLHIPTLPSGSTDPSVATPQQPGRRLEHLARLSLIALALSLGLGDIADLNPVAAVVLNTVHGLLFLTIGLALAAALRAHRWPRYPAPLALPLAVWLTVLVISAALAPSHRAEALATLARPASGALLAWAVTDLCRRRADWLQLLFALAIGGLGVAAVALAEASGSPLTGALLNLLRDGDIPIGDVPRVAATLSHPNEAAMLLELALPLLVAAAWSKASSRWRLPLTLAAMATLLAIVLTFSRAGVVTALLALGLLGILAARSGQRARLHTAAAIALVVPLALLWTAVVDQGLDRRLLAGLDESSSLQPPRTQFWSVATEMLRDRPLLGVGPDNFRWRFADYAGIDADNLGIHAHNQYLEALADTGLLGFLSLCWLLAALVLRSVRSLRLASREEWPWRAALLASLSTWLVHAVLDDFERFWPTSIAFWLIAGLSLALSSTRTTSSRQRLNSQ
jgi:O-antigen ligase